MRGARAWHDRFGAANFGIAAGIAVPSRIVCGAAQNERAKLRPAQLRGAGIGQAQTRRAGRCDRGKGAACPAAGQRTGFGHGQIDMGRRGRRRRGGPDQGRD
ncbi:MAG: hypothetical protein ACI9U6_000075 [Loktanella salsilacus]|jgi:hypothetical protein